MARYGTPQRRSAPPRKTTTPKRATLTARITPEALDKAHLMADALGISLSALILEMLERATVDENGHPGFDSRYARPAEDDEEQLELSA